MAQSVIADVAGEQLSWLARGRRRFEPVMLLWVALILVLLFLVVNPVLRLLVSSFEATDSGKLTLANYVIAYGHLRGWSALLNSLLYGAAVLRTIFKVTLPLVTPAIIGGSIITFLDAVALFGTPAIIALPARINVMTLQLWQYFEFPVRAEAAAAYSIPLIGITCLLFWLQRLIIGRKGYVALTGKTVGRRLIRMGGFRWVLLAYTLLVCALALFLPFGALGQAAFSKAWGRGLSWASLTIDNFHYLLFEQYNAQQTIIHSFTYSAVAASGSVALALGVAYVVSRRLVPFGNALTLLCTAPFVIPGIVLAIGFYAAYAPRPFSLYGTAAILILAFMTRFLPATRELSTAIFLVGADTRVIAVMLLDLSEDGNFETLSALGCFLLVVTVLVVLAAYKLLGRDVLLRRT